MSDPLVVDILHNVSWALDQIERRFTTVSDPADFTSGDLGLEKLDSICMQLINIGEALKHIDKLTMGQLLPRYPGIDWKKAMGLRDIITHHYFDIDAEIIFSVCKERLPALHQTIRQMLTDQR